MSHAQTTEALQGRENFQFLRAAQVILKLNNIHTRTKSNWYYRVKKRNT